MRDGPGGIRLFLLGMALLLPTIALDSSLTGSDEYRVSFRTAMETEAREDWTIPTLDGEPRFRKPPLMYWLLSASIHFFGSHPFSLRIWGVIFAVLMGLVTANIARKSLGTPPLLTFLILMATVGIATESRRAMLDIPMAFLLICSASMWLQWRSDGGTGRAIGAGLLLGLATLIKPTALLFAITGMISVSLLGPKRTSGSILFHPLLTLLMLLATAIPWWLVAHQAHPELFEQQWGEQIARREMSWIHVEAIPSVLGGLLGLIFPWTVAAIAGLIHFIRGREEGLENPERWMVLWVILSTIPFFFLKSFERYLIPLLPVLAMLVASYLDGLELEPRKKQLRIAAFLMGIPSLLIAAFVGWFQCSMVAAALIPMMWVAMSMYARRGSTINTALCGACQITLIMGFALPSIGIGSLPRIPDSTQQTTFATVGMDLLPTLMLRRQEVIPILPLQPDQMAVAFPDDNTTLFLMDEHLAQTSAALEQSGRKYHRVGTFQMFRSRKIFTRFPRADATVEDWLHAIEERSLDPLRIRCTMLHVEERKGS